MAQRSVRFAKPCPLCQSLPDKDYFAMGTTHPLSPGDPGTTGTTGARMGTVCPTVQPRAAKPWEAIAVESCRSI